MDFSQVLDEIITVNDANLLINQLEELVDSKYKKDSLDKNLKKIDFRFYEILSEHLRKETGEIFLKDLLIKVRNLKKLKIGLFFSPTRAQLEKFSKKLEEIVGEKVLIEVEDNVYSKDLKVTFFWEGKYGEF